MTVRALESGFWGKVVFERIIRNGQPLAVTPEFILEAGDRAALVGSHGPVAKVGQMLGPETINTEKMDLIGGIKDVLITSKEIEGKTFSQAKQMIDQEVRRGVYTLGLFRLDQEIEILPSTTLSRGDVIRLEGPTEDVNRLAKAIGYPLVPSNTVDYAYLGIGVLAGILLGMITIPLAGVPIALGTGGGCLLSGLVFGWLRAKHPTFGNLPSATAQHLRDFGLAIFIASVGLATGPQAIDQIRQYGVTLPLVGLAVVTIPCVASVFYGRYVLKMNPVILCGALTGNLTSTPSLNAVMVAADSNTPMLGYTVSYAIANVLLTFLGPVIVFSV